jgi:secreted trypsin-like serine protease
LNLTTHQIATNRQNVAIPRSDRAVVVRWVGLRRCISDAAWESGTPGKEVEFMRRRVQFAILTCILCLSFVPSHAIVGGGAASAGEYPWMAAIRTDLNGQYCGGSLVAPSVVVTARHCVQELIENTFALLPLEPVKVRVTLGRLTLNGSGGETIAVRALHGHSNPDVDAAVLELSRASVQTPIAWARPGQESLYAAGVLATVTGWGATSEGGAGSNTLKEAQVHIVSDAQCRQTYSDLVDSAMVCAGEPQGGVDTCQGDSGGPLMVPKPGGGFLLAGLTSFGDGCARPNTPGVYTEVVSASAFIDTYA